MSQLSPQRSKGQPIARLLHGKAWPRSLDPLQVAPGPERKKKTQKKKRRTPKKP